MEVFGRMSPIARKEHTCDLCHRAIHKGEKYERWAYSDEGHANSISVHTICKSVLDSCLGFEQEFSWYEIEDYVREVCSGNNLCPEDTPLSEMVILVDDWNRRPIMTKPVLVHQNESKKSEKFDDFIQRQHDIVIHVTSEALGIPECVLKGDYQGNRAKLNTPKDGQNV